MALNRRVFIIAQELRKASLPNPVHFHSNLPLAAVQGIVMDFIYRIILVSFAVSSVIEFLEAKELKDVMIALRQKRQGCGPQCGAAGCCGVVCCVPPPPPCCAPPPPPPPPCCLPAPPPPPPCCVPAPVCAPVCQPTCAPACVAAVPVCPPVCRPACAPACIAVASVGCGGGGCGGGGCGGGGCGRKRRNVSRGLRKILTDASSEEISNENKSDQDQDGDVKKRSVYGYGSYGSAAGYGSGDYGNGYGSGYGSENGGYGAYGGYGGQTAGCRQCHAGY